MFRKISSLAKLIIIDGIRRNAILGLVLLALACETGGLFFFDFIPRDIGRASADFVLSIGWMTGFIFLFFHCVQTAAWDKEKRTIHTILARPISRTQYVLGVFLGLSILLLFLNCILSFIGYGILVLIKNSVKPVYFQNLSMTAYILSWFGLYYIEVAILSIILFFTSIIRGGLPVLLLSISYYFICFGLPVVRASVEQLSGESGKKIEPFLYILTMLFPDFGKFDFKSMVVGANQIDIVNIVFIDSLLLLGYITIVLCCTAFLYQRRDLQ